MKNSDPGGGVPHGVLCGISCRLLDTNPNASPLNVNMLGDARRRGHELQQLIGKIHRFDRAQPQPLDRSFLQKLANQVHQPDLPRKIPAPAPQIDSTEHDLAILRGERAHLSDDGLSLRTAAGGY